MRDIQTLDDIKLIVDLFYNKILQDGLLAPFFTNLNLVNHLHKMVHFWSFVLLDEAGYTTNVVEKHLKMHLTQQHFDRWLELFSKTLDENFVGEKVEIAKQRAYTIAWTTKYKLNIN